MLRPSSIARMRAELGALETIAERAGTALACVYSSAAEFHAAEIAAWRAGRLASPRTIDVMRLILVATIVAAVATLAVLAVSTELAP